MRDIIKELEIIKKMIGIIAIKDKSFKEQVRILSIAGLKPKEISFITGKNVNIVSVLKNRLDLKEKRK